MPVIRGESGEPARLGAAVAEAGWRELVVKPAIGVGGSGVARTNRAGLPAALRRFSAGTEVMVQPFADAVVDEGEFSFVFIGGALSHALHKRPAAGDFRAHGIYGGTLELVVPDRADVADVTAIVERLPFDLLSARVDVVRWHGALCVLELELIEPMLYFDLAPGSADRFAEATVAMAR